MRKPIPLNKDLVQEYIRRCWLKKIQYSFDLSIIAGISEPLSRRNLRGRVGRSIYNVS